MSRFGHCLVYVCMVALSYFLRTLYCSLRSQYGRPCTRRYIVLACASLTPSCSLSLALGVSISSFLRFMLYAHDLYLAYALRACVLGTVIYIVLSFPRTWTYALRACVLVSTCAPLRSIAVRRVFHSSPLRLSRLAPSCSTRHSVCALPL